jgi:hypothetical protein
MSLAATIPSSSLVIQSSRAYRFCQRKQPFVVPLGIDARFGRQRGRQQERAGRLLKLRLSTLDMDLKAYCYLMVRRRTSRDCVVTRYKSECSATKSRLLSPASTCVGANFGSGLVVSGQATK